MVRQTAEIKPVSARFGWQKPIPGHDPDYLEAKLAFGSPIL
jgi:hypothetical protein